jgi:transposase
MDREVRRRLAVLRHVEEVSGNVAMTCRYYGISRPTYYKWLRRYEAEGVDGLRDHSRRPRTSPNATQAEVVDKIIHLRRNYHFGPAKIAMYLQRYHDVTISASGVWRILHRLGMGRLPVSQRYQRHDRRWKRYEKQRPGHQVQIDVKFVEPLPKAGKTGVPLKPVGRRGKFYQFTAIDDCTRLRIMKIYPRLNQKTAIQFLDYVLAQLPFSVEKIQTDNGVEFATQFHWHVLDKGIGHVYIKPRTPRLNGKVERSHRIDAEEFYRLLDGVVIDDVNVFNARLKEWQDYYNYDRPHGGLGGQTPMRDSARKHKAQRRAEADHRQLHTPSDTRANHTQIRRDINGVLVRLVAKIQSEPLVELAQAVRPRATQGSAHISQRIDHGVDLRVRDHGARRHVRQLRLGRHALRLCLVDHVDER